MNQTDTVEAPRADRPASRKRLPATRGLIERVSALSLRDLLVIVGVVSFLVRLPWIVGPVNGRLASDSGIYLGTAHDLLHGRGFATAGAIRTPGYPLLVAILGDNADVVVIFQHLLGVGAVVALVWAAWRFFGRGAAILTAVVAALSPVLVNLEGDVLPDFVFGVVALVGAIIYARALEVEKPQWRRLAAAGGAFGFAALVKPVGQALIVTALVPLLVGVRRPKRALRACAVVASTFVLVISPWVVRNTIRYGDPRLSVQGDAALWLRVFDWDKRPLPTGTAQDRFAKSLYERALKKSDYQSPTNTYENVWVELKTRYGYTDREAVSFERRIALEAIRDAPGAYVRGTWRVVKDLISYTHELYPARFGINAEIEAADPVLPKTPSFKAFGLAQRVVRLWWIVSLQLLSLFVLVFTGPRRQRVAVIVLGMTWLVVTVATAATTWPDPRYAAEVVPLLWLLGSAGAALVLRGVLAVVRAY